MFNSRVTSLESRILIFDVFFGFIVAMMVTMRASTGTTCSQSHEAIIWFNIRPFSRMTRFLLSVLLYRTLCFLLSAFTIMHGMIYTIVALIVKELRYVVLKISQRLFFCYIINGYTPLSVPKVMSWYWLKSFLPSSIPYLKFYRNFINFH